MVLSQSDHDVIALYADMLPMRIFDAHMHLYTAETIPNFYDPQGVFYAETAAPEDYLADMRPFLPNVERIGMNMIPMPDWAQADAASGLRERANAHVLSFYDHENARVACPFVLPGDTEQYIYALAENPATRSFKCYCYGAATGEWDTLTVDRFLPEALWVVANEKKLPIILHMMLPKALSDPRNFDYIAAMTAKYPNAQLVLAHCARGFAAWTAVEAIPKLPDRENIWFDLSAICEAGPVMAAIMKNAGKRVMWGSDYPVCAHRGRAVSVADKSSWLLGDGFSDVERAHIIAENLLAVKQAALLLKLDATQIEDIFYNNAASLFHLENH